MPEPSVPLRDIPQFEFHGDGIFFDPPGCNHGSVNEGTPEALANSLTINGDGEDHLLPPYAIFPETFSQDLLDVERESVLALEPEEAFASIAANPRYEGPAYEEVKATSEDIHLDLQKELVRLRSNPKAYMKRVREIGDHIYHIPSNSVLPTNHKMLKGVEHGWRTEGIVLAPNVLAGLRDVCPFRSPLCTANCLNLSGLAEWAGGQSGDVVDCRRRRTLMFMHVRDAFMARVAGLLDQRSAALPGRYAVRLNVTSDLRWEKLKFYSPWTEKNVTFPQLFPGTQFYDYTKNCERYQDWMHGLLPQNYYLTFSMSEINSLYAIYALAQGGAVTVIFDALPRRVGGDAHVAYPAEPIPESFCGFPVIDGDETDLRFEDRMRFGISDGQGFVIGLRLKGKRHRREHNRDKSAAAGFIFDAKREYGREYTEELIANSERKRLLALQARSSRDLPGAGKQKFVGIPDALVVEAKRALGF